MVITMHQSTEVTTKVGNITIHTHHNSEDNWNQLGWHTRKTILREGMPIEEIVDLKVSQTWEEAIKNHSQMCESLAL